MDSCHKNDSRVCFSGPYFWRASDNCVPIPKNIRDFAFNQESQVKIFQTLLMNCCDWDLEQFKRLFIWLIDKAHNDTDDIDNDGRPTFFIHCALLRDLVEYFGCNSDSRHTIEYQDYKLKIRDLLKFDFIIDYLNKNENCFLSNDFIYNKEVTAIEIRTEYVRLQEEDFNSAEKKLIPKTKTYCNYYACFESIVIGAISLKHIHMYEPQSVQNLELFIEKHLDQECDFENKHIATLLRIIENMNQFLIKSCKKNGDVARYIDEMSNKRHKQMSRFYKVIFSCPSIRKFVESTALETAVKI